MTKNKYDAQKRYHEKVGMLTFVIKINPHTENDILNAIKSKGKYNQSAYIKKLIRDDIAKNKK